jgi:hypothetical protein
VTALFCPHSVQLEMDAKLNVSSESISESELAPRAYVYLCPRDGFVAPFLACTRVVNSMTVRQAQAYILQVRYSRSAQALFPVG